MFRAILSQVEKREQERINTCMRIKVNLDQMAVDIKNIRYYLGLSQYYRLSVSIFLHPPRRKTTKRQITQDKIRG